MLDRPWFRSNDSVLVWSMEYLIMIHTQRSMNQQSYDSISAILWHQLSSKSMTHRQSWESTIIINGLFELQTSNDVQKPNIKRILTILLNQWLMGIIGNHFYCYTNSSSIFEPLSMNQHGVQSQLSSKMGWWTSQQREAFFLLREQPWARSGEPTDTRHSSTVEHYLTISELSPSKQLPINSSIIHGPASHWLTINQHHESTISWSGS